MTNLAPVANNPKAAPRVLLRFEPREPKIAVARTAGQRLRPFQTNATCCISLEIKPTNVRQDFLISVTNCEFAEAAGLVVDAEIKVVAGLGLDEIVDEVVRIFFRMALCRLLAQSRPGSPET